MSGAKLVFKRREKRGLPRALWEWVYPRGGWARAYSYIKHRLRRLPGTPEEIARGVAIGVFTSFTPFYGLHFLLAWVLALVLRANVLASLLGTFFGNPLTYIPIGATALGFGHAFLGKRPESDLHLGLGEMFARAVSELGANIVAFFIANRRRLDVFGRILAHGVFPLDDRRGGAGNHIRAGDLCYYCSRYSRV